MEKLIIRDAVAAAEGEGAQVNRLFPVQGFMNYDPFVLWDDFSVPPSAGFPDHPHRGFEGVTYIFNGSMQHKDNLGNTATVEAGGLQRFTAGSGIVHSEMPSADNTTRGIQLWVNLSSTLKKVDPEYQQVNADEVIERPIENGRVRYLIGEDAALKIKTPMLYLDVSLDNGEYTKDIPQGYRGFIYLVEGEVEVNGEVIIAHQAQFHSASETLQIKSNDKSRFLICFGKPHDEPIYQHGPFVD